MFPYTFSVFNILVKIGNLRHQTQSVLSFSLSLCVYDSVYTYICVFVLVRIIHNNMFVWWHKTIPRNFATSSKSLLRAVFTMYIRAHGCYCVRCARVFMQLCHHTQREMSDRTHKKAYKRTHRERDREGARERHTYNNNQSTDSMRMWNVKTRLGNNHSK